MIIKKSNKIGFCYGVRHALDMLERVTRERSGIETLGEIVHNKQVIQRLSNIGVRVAQKVGEIQGNAIVLGTHGVTPDIEEQIRAKNKEVIDTTCPFVHRAQITARRLSETGFFVIVYGDANHDEVKGILGWAGGKGIATTEISTISSLTDLPRRIGILSQTTQIPEKFTEFIKGIFYSIYKKDCEIQIVDTICHDIRERQAAALELAKQVDIMLVVGGRNSANTTHLAELCSLAIKTYKIETANEINPTWFRDKQRVGITAGASTSEETIDEIVKRLQNIGV
jgi:4-hydroxy-3-methylbut-2-en-1-yl diphosphate reductase